MQISFPYPVRLQSSVPVLSGMRFEPFTNIDGEAYAKPALNGFWRVDMSVVAMDMQGRLALSSFITAMSAANATCLVPICTQIRPNDQNGRMLAGGSVGPEYTFNHVGFEAEPFGGFTLRAAASHRDSYIDINKPELSQLWPGHYITIGESFYQIVNTTSINESSTAIRVSVMPNIRGNHDSGKVVIVDHLRLRCRMEGGDQIGVGSNPFKTSSLSFVEAF